MVVKNSRKNVVATTCKQNISLFQNGNYHLITDKNELTIDNIAKINPRYIFFPHWSYRIPSQIYNKYECIGFHMTNLPFGRGGTPLQNLISRGIYDTKVSAFRITGELDAGDIYLKAPLKLIGNAEDIYARCTKIIYGMVNHIETFEPKCTKQTGKIVTFKRMGIDDARIPMNNGIVRIYDWIRMLDADGYPHAFIDEGEYRLYFSGAVLNDGEVNADVKIVKRDCNDR